MEAITKELNGATEYIRAMKRTKKYNNEDLDNLLMHLGKIEDAVNKLFIGAVSWRSGLFNF